jgi:hypothetical protein
MVAVAAPSALASAKSATITVDGVQLPAGTVVTKMTTATVVSVVKENTTTSTVRLSTGVTTTIPTADAALTLRAAKALQPDNEVSGNCGDSYIYLGLKSNGKPLESDTGFIITLENVSSYVWQASYSGPNSFAFQGQTTGGAVLIGVEKNFVFSSLQDGGHGAYRGAVSASSKACSPTASSVTAMDRQKTIRSKRDKFRQ